MGIIQNLVLKIKQIISLQGFNSIDSIRDLLRNACYLTAVEYDPFINDMKFIYNINNHLIIFHEMLEFRKDKIQDCFKLKIINPYHKQIFYIKQLGKIWR